MLKLLYENIGEPNIDNLIKAEKKKYVKYIKKLYLIRRNLTWQ